MALAACASGPPGDSAPSSAPALTPAPTVVRHAPRDLDERDRRAVYLAVVRSEAEVDEQIREEYPDVGSLGLNAGGSSKLAQKQSLQRTSLRAKYRAIVADRYQLPLDQLAAIIREGRAREWHREVGAKPVDP